MNFAEDPPYYHGDDINGFIFDAISQNVRHEHLIKHEKFIRITKNIFYGYSYPYVGYFLKKSVYMNPNGALKTYGKIDDKIKRFEIFIIINLIVSGKMYVLLEISRLLERYGYRESERDLRDTIADTHSNEADGRLNLRSIFDLTDTVVVNNLKIFFGILFILSYCYLDVDTFRLAHSQLVRILGLGCERLDSSVPNWIRFPLSTSDLTSFFHYPTFEEICLFNRIAITMGGRYPPKGSRHAPIGIDEHDPTGKSMEILKIQIEMILTVSQKCDTPETQKRVRETLDELLLTYEKTNMGECDLMTIADRYYFSISVD
jgi:hypothetical protein